MAVCKGNPDNLEQGSAISIVDVLDLEWKFRRGKKGGRRIGAILACFYERIGHRSGKEDSSK